MYAGCVSTACHDPDCAVEHGIDAGAFVLSPDIALTEADLGAYVSGLAVSADGATVGVGLGDGRVLAGPADSVEGLDEIARHAGVVTALAAVDGGFLSGGDDGKLMRDGVTLADFGKSWVEHLAVDPATGNIAVAAGRLVHILAADGAEVAVFDDHPSTVSGLALAADGAYVAAAHYNGLSLWPTAGDKATARRLDWKGSHTGLSWSPSGRFLVTTTQDKDLHCWDLETGKDMKMSGYPTKIRALSWTGDGEFLCAAGADTVTSWSFGGSGPSGKPPLELGYVFNGVVSCVAAHAKRAWVAGGYDTGTVLLGDIVRGDALIARTDGDGMITALRWAEDGRTVFAGTAKGRLTRMRMTGRGLG